MSPAMIDGAMKMPEPIIEPTISVVALKTPRRRSSVSAMAAFVMGRRAIATKACYAGGKMLAQLLRRKSVDQATSDPTGRASAQAHARPRST